MLIATASLSHGDAPLSVREKFALDAQAMREATRDLARTLQPLVSEAAVVSTCNRTEVYLAGPRGGDPSHALSGWLQNRFGVGRRELDDHWRKRQDDDAVRHLFRVASGLESMVIGEPQILGQIKGAARVAQDEGTLGSHLHQLFQKSFSVAKEVRHSTSVGQEAVSLGSASVRAAQRVFGDLGQCKILFIGAGEMINLTATHFAAHRPLDTVIANRTVERGAQLAKKVGARCRPLSGLGDALHEFDVVVSCTSSQLPIIGLGAVQQAICARRRRPMVMIDLAVPRDIEQAVHGIEDVFLYTIDDLGMLLAKNLSRREDALSQAGSIIDRRTDDFMRWLDQRRSVPIIRDLHSQVDRFKEAEVERAMRALRRGDDPVQVLKLMANALSAKFTHGPMTMLRGSERQKAAIGEVLQHLLPTRH